MRAVISARTSAEQAASSASNPSSLIIFVSSIALSGCRDDNASSARRNRPTRFSPPPIATQA